MENSWFRLFALISTLAVISISIFKQNPKRNLPPGPKPWPIIGNLHLIASDPRRSLHSLSQKYGDTMLLYLGKFPVVITSSSDMARQFLKVHDSVFASRPPLAAGKYTAYDFKDTAWAPYGPYWKQARKIIHTEVFNDKRFESFKYIRAEERRTLVSRLYSLSGKTITLKDHLSKYTLSIICRMVITKKYFDEPGHEKSAMKLDELETMLEELLELNGAFNIGDWIPWLDFLDLQGAIRKMKAAQKKLDMFHNFVIDDHEATKDLKTKDLLDVLLKQAEDPDPNLEVKLTRDHVKGLVQDLLNGGTDTTSKAIEWAIREVMAHPDVAEKAKAELDSVIGRNRWVEEEDLPQLPYIDAIVIESLRLHPSAKYLTFHYSMEDCKVAGYDIRKGTIVLIDVWSIARNPNSWDSPHEFMPERFLGKQVDILWGNNFTVLPFGSGRRRCPGIVLALGVLRATVANLLHGFDMKVADGAIASLDDLRLEDTTTAVTSAKVPLAVVMEPTLPHHLY